VFSWHCPESPLSRVCPHVDGPFPSAQDFVATTEDEYVRLATKFILSRHALQDAKARVVAVDLAPLFDTSPASVIAPLFRLLIDEHPSTELLAPVDDVDECIRSETLLLLEAAKGVVDDAHVQQVVRAVCSTSSGEARRGRLADDPSGRNDYGGPLRAGVPVNVTALLEKRGLLPVSRT
jgi:hypothetical protein